MNVIFLSPNFPPNYERFCTHLRALGANVLGLSDQPYDTLSGDLRAALSEYYLVPDLHNYDELLRAVGYFTHRYGKIDRIDSLNEHWLETEARLRTDFNVEGFRLADLPAIKRKSEMKRRFAAAGVETARAIVADDPAEVRAFAAEVGFPLVAKPDVGVGAARTYKIETQAELEAFLEQPLGGYLLEEFVRGVIQTFDGLTDRSGAPVFFTSMQYSSGVMEVVNEDTDVYYYTQREVPADIAHAGRAIISAFGLRERFFHFEFFRTPEGRLVALEVNMRPPGGLSLDLFNYANDIDLYYEWANVLVRGQFDARYDWPYHACYIGRKHGKRYAHSHEAALGRFGSRIVHQQPMASVFHRAMGSHGYIARAAALEEVLEVARYLQKLA
jgi:hypothetical protein